MHKQASKQALTVESVWLLMYRMRETMTSSTGPRSWPSKWISSMMTRPTCVSVCVCVCVLSFLLDVSVRLSLSHTHKLSLYRTIYSEFVGKGEK